MTTGSLWVRCFCFAPDGCAQVAAHLLSTVGGQWFERVHVAFASTVAEAISSGIPKTVTLTNYGNAAQGASAPAHQSAANGWDSVFPSASGAQASANAFALQVGGGVDLVVLRRLALRPLPGGLGADTVPEWGFQCAE